MGSDRMILLQGTCIYYSCAMELMRMLSVHAPNLCLHPLMNHLLMMLLLLPSGFRVIPLEPKAVECSFVHFFIYVSAIKLYNQTAGGSMAARTLDLASALEFTYESHFAALQQWLDEYDSHRAELFRCEPQVGDSLLKLLWHYPEAIMCCTLRASPVFLFANQAGLDLLETTLVALQDITLEKILDDGGRKLFLFEFSKIMQQSLLRSHSMSGPSLSPLLAHGGVLGGRERMMASAEQLVLDICDPELRENALLELSKKREIFQDLAPLLWNSYGTITALFADSVWVSDLTPMASKAIYLHTQWGSREIVSIYPFLSPPTLSPGASNRVCNALALLQCVAAHLDTRAQFLNAHIPLYLYPFLNTTSKTRPFEYLRLTSLGVIGALVKVATFIIQKILLDDRGLQYIYENADRFFAVTYVLGTMVDSLAEQPSTRLLKHIIRCYLRLTDYQRGCIALQERLPKMLKDGSFNGFLDEPTTCLWLQQLLINVYGDIRGAALNGGLD
ncbi:hypothetical protein HPP92_026300 [Vanilla planifolia]|uniref:MEKHLA domain-containing protein n=1 Tax=Vanilla planifolia TaxID=51239 RepID=A0A835PDE2_VANPL|nr:hypothetical protein HPP92_026300 [Vanilla planifolia]